MTTRFYNTLSRSLEPFEPIDSAGVRFYTCGPTVYDHAHIGNFRAYMFEDLLKRYLGLCGYPVTHIMNLTDVDDKTIRGANAQGKALKEFTQPFVDGFFNDLKTLNIQPADKYPAATDHVGAMIGMIKTLEEKGFAYKSEDGSVYFSIEKTNDYGKLAHLDREGLRPGARVSQDEYEKENVADFALWKAWTEEDGDVGWDSPWGRGRPGWHIECSAMAMEYLGESFDIHAGGIDNIFPHHEDEIAQSEAATGKPFVKYWMHCAHLIVDGKKMSKSLDNFFTLPQLTAQGYTGREIRYELLATHYRQTLNFTLGGLIEKRTALKRIDEFQARLAALAGDHEASVRPPEWAGKTLHNFKAALDDDLNVSGALAVVFDLVHDGNRALDLDKVSAGEAQSVRELLCAIDAVLGIIKPEATVVDAQTVNLAEQREEARQAKNWDEADRLRAEITALGWEVKDTRDGPKLSRL